MQGILNQASNQIYQGNQLGCHKGHLYPAMAASGNPANAANSVESTYQFTNAVPQCGAFNTGQWRVFEGRIRNYARNTCIRGGGRLYLLSGVSFVAIQNTQPPQPIRVPIHQLHIGIYKPSSMWTAGACLRPGHRTDSFAVIGNNVPHPPGMLTQETTLIQLENILTFDVTTNGLKRAITADRRVKLFPGAGKSIPIELPEEEYPPTDESKGSKKPPSPKSSPKKPSSSPGASAAGSKKPSKFKLKFG